MNLIYVVNFYGTPPLNYIEKYIKEETDLKLTILKLPSVKAMKNRLFFDAFLIEPTGERKEFTLSFWFPFPLFLVFAFQYLLNILAFIVLMLRCGTKTFEIGIGETSFGSFVIYILRFFKIVKFSVYMDGDILPDPTAASFYFSEASSFASFADKILIKFQYFLRAIGLKNDLIWYPSKKVQEWDKLHGFIARDVVYAPAVAVDKQEVERNAMLVRDDMILGYIGRLDTHAGVDITLESMKYIVTEITNAILYVVGGGSLAVEKYEKLAKSYGIERNIKFFGYVADMQEALDYLKKAKLGFATYQPVAENVSLYTDVSKPKEYIKCGIPVVITRGGPDVSELIEKYNAGIVVPYDAKEIARAVISVLKDPTAYKELQKGVVAFGNECDYRVDYKNLINTLKQKYENAQVR